jgi:chemotaxis protein MotB
MSGRKKPEPPQEEGAPAWMNTYGDMVTLVLTFFVLLFSFSTVDAEKWQQLVNSLAGRQVITAIANPGNTGNSTSGPDTMEEWLKDNEGNDDDDGAILNPEPVPTETNDGQTGSQGNVAVDFNQLYEEIKEHIVVNGLEATLYIEKTDNVIILRISDSALFDSGKADIKKESLELLRQVGEIFTKYQDSIQMIRIEGHTDNVPISTSHYVDNWDLSTSRATNVLRYFLETCELSPDKFSSVGYGEFHPVASNDTEEGKAQNRRVDFVIQSYTAGQGEG